MTLAISVPSAIDQTGGPPFVPNCASMAAAPLVGGALPDGECGRVWRWSVVTSLLMRCPGLTVDSPRAVRPARKQGLQRAPEDEF
jgi:hypothetical protein